MANNKSGTRYSCLLLLFIGIPLCGWAAPPFSGTIFLDGDIITDSDYSTFLSLTPAGTGSRLVFDRRENDFLTMDMFLFQAGYESLPNVEFQVNMEFGSEETARTEAEFYARTIGRLPTALRQDVQTVTIHKGTEAFGGGNNNLLIHTGQGEAYLSDGILEETLAHESSHTSLDGRYGSNQGWLDAQAADPDYISTYAMDFPDREDMAESFLPYLAVRYRSDRISEDLRQTIEETIPSRLAFFDSLSLDMYPLAPRAEDDLDVARQAQEQSLQGIIRLDGRPTAASFTAGAFLADATDARNEFTPDEQVAIIATVLPEAADVGKAAGIYAVIKTIAGSGTTWQYRDVDGIFRPWNGRLADLGPAREVGSLAESERLTIFEGKLEAARHRIFIGYLLSDGPAAIHFNTLGFKVDVE